MCSVFPCNYSESSSSSFFNIDPSCDKFSRPAFVSGKKEEPIEQLSSDGASADSDELDEEDLAGDEFAREQRKKTGLPELELDGLPSAIANKMLNLDNVSTHGRQQKSMYVCLSVSMSVSMSESMSVSK